MAILIKLIVKSISVIKEATKRMLTTLMVSDTEMIKTAIEQYLTDKPATTVPPLIIETVYAAGKVYPTAMQFQTDLKDRWENWSQSSIAMDQKDCFRNLVAVIKAVVVLQVFWFNILQILL